MLFNFVRLHLHGDTRNYPASLKVLLIKGVLGWNFRFLDNGMNKQLK